MFFSLFHRPPKLDTQKQIKKALMKEMKKRDKLESKADALKAKMDELMKKHQELEKKMKEAQASEDHETLRKLTSENLENNRQYHFIKQKYLQIDHELMFAKKNVEQYEKLLVEKEGKSIEK